MFNIRMFIKRGLLDAIGKWADYQVILSAAEYHEKGVLLEEDLEELQRAIEARYNEYIQEEIIIEE